MSTAVVIGGGISGLSSVYYLQKSSKFSKIILVEATNRVGGWVTSINTEAGAIKEMGPRSIRPSGGSGFNTIVLVEELGLSTDILPVLHSHPASQNRYIYADGRLNKLPTSLLAQMSKQPPFSKSFFQYFKHDFFAPRNLKEDESIYDFIARRFGTDLAEYGADPLCRGIYAGDCRTLSVKSCFPVLQQAEALGGSVVIGMIRSAKKPEWKPCALWSKRVQERWSSYSFKRGVQQLPEKLLEAIDQTNGCESLLGTPCSALNFKDGQALVTVNGEEIKADHVVSSLYAPQLASLLPPQLTTLKEQLSKIPAVTAVVVSLEYDGKVKMPVLGFGHLLPSKENSMLLGVIYDSCTFPYHDRRDKPSTRFTVMMGGSWFDDLKRAVPSMSDQDLGQLATDALKSQLGITEHPESIHVATLPNCIPQYALGHDKILDTVFSTIKQHQLPLSLVGSSYRGSSINDCINNARKQVEIITGVDLK